MKKKRVLFISSTGGHFSELSQLSDIYDNYDYHIITEKTKANSNLKEKYGKRLDYLVFGTKDHLFSYMFKFGFNILKSIYLFFKIRPEYIVTTGTHTAIPMCYIGHFFGSKVIFIETFANSKTKTLSGRIAYPIADLFVVQWEEMLKKYPDSTFGGWIY